ncbi:PAB-dependent poly(A)-specific ribonuclease subunit 3 [Exophiala xenobiotica]|uniref:PAN2-PAN3 deadenylation complex subunit PAN3 n=1 Tax=Lithohypha guttulata TaxID=1690604 RepID=A0ABR0KHU7_9EURO|nr:PAB-dependent poly(A)-specific ribonuclease subunit 3 [Lithohypha guttulata]KAK5327233.1 PAB-dependent poly(A)-specific ribonuclease subunit 3 [Exophiala xenobiotica]
MAAVSKANTEEPKTNLLSPKSKNKDNAKEILCRNVTIYGKCRYEDKGCAFNHKVEKAATPEGAADSHSKKSFSVDSPSFTPSFLSPGDGAKTALRPSSTTISPKAASAAPFLPKQTIPRPNTSTPPVRQDARTPDWALPGAQEFVPGRLDPSALQAQDVNDHRTPHFDSFPTNHPPLNPYLDPNGAAFFQAQSMFQQPLQYHQYAPLGPYNTNMLPYQRTVHDLFLPNDLREDLQKRMAAALQTLPNSQLPQHIESYHSLVPLDTTHHKSSSIFGGYHSWVYKAQSSANGHFFVLRRIEGFRLTNELAIRSVQPWKHLVSANVVRTADVFTNRSFGDSSLFVVTDYHPLSKTLAEHHHIGHGRHVRGRNSIDQVPETVLWSYVTQLASALKTIHNGGLAARVLDTSKVLVTGKNRIRLNGCAVMDVIQHEAGTPLPQLQRQDLVNFGLTILSVGANVADASQNFARAMDQFKRFYKPELQNAVVWLYSAQQYQDRTTDQFITLISSQMIAAFDAALHADDNLHTELAREVENARLVRLLTKLNFINERPEFEHDRQWAENGERFFLKLFRDYVFHQVDAQGHPVVDLAHVLSCMNKLDAGMDEHVTLISRDEQNCFVVSYRELKKAIESAFQDLNSHARRI